jgi:hypothetical protein
LNIKVSKLQCDKCNQEHEINIDYSKLTENQRSGKEPALTNIVCPNLATMYLVNSFVLDTRSALLQNDNVNNKLLEQSFLNRFGAENFDHKLKRFIDLNLNFIGIPEEYYSLLTQIIEAYSCGYFYPAIASAGALGERILNRLVIKIRKHYSHTKHYKKIWNKNSFDNWDSVILILQDWNIISEEVGKLFLEFKMYRNNVIHYNDGYDFEQNVSNAIEILIKIINKQFSYLHRKDLFWTFDSPGEILIKSEVINNPFVIEFILPNCVLITPYSVRVAEAVHETKRSQIILRPISDAQFIELRNNKHLPL